jgi:hypothetical protein
VLASHRVLGDVLLVEAGELVSIGDEDLLARVQREPGGFVTLALRPR